MYLKIKAAPRTNRGLEDHSVLTRHCGRVVRAERLAVCAALVMSAGAVRADILAHWTFESSRPPTVQGPVGGPFLPEAGIRIAESSVISSHRDILATNSGPAGNGSGFSMSSNWWLAGDAYLFYTDTSRYESLTFSFDQTRSSTGPSAFVLGVSLNGVDFVDMASYSVSSITWSTVTPQPASSFGPYNVPGVANDQQWVVFRLQSVANGSSTAGTSRIDNIVLSGTLVPSPGSALVVLGALCGLTRGRKRSV